MHAVNHRLRLAGQVRDAHRPPLPLQPRFRRVNDVSHCFLPLATLQQFTVVSCKLLVLEGGEERRRGNWSHGGTPIPGVCVRVARKGLTRHGVRKSGKQRTYRKAFLRFSATGEVAERDTPVVTGSMRNRLRRKRIEAPRGACDGGSEARRESAGYPTPGVLQKECGSY